MKNSQIVKQHYLVKHLPKILSQLKSFNPRLFDYVTEKRDLEKMKKEIPGSTFLWGKTGAGKTTMMMEMVLQWTYNRYMDGCPNIDFEIINQQDFLQQLRDSYKNNSVSETELMEKYKKASLLCLDDFEAEKISDWTYKQLYRLAEYRLSNYKTTFYTCNYSLNRIAEMLDDDRITRRIQDDCNPRIFQF